MSERDMFEAALELPPENRLSYLDGVCGSDAALRRRLEALLGKHDQAGSFLEEPAIPALALAKEPALSEQPGTVIGSYKLLEQIGEGGFGMVFMAEQQQPVRRNVALKVLKAGMDTRQVVARFEAERQVLALMSHPNIAQVFDGGATAGGRPYFVMELVKGMPITDYCDQDRLTPRQRLELFLDVCQAVQHAHQKGIIHRDLKPSNILVTRHDAGAPAVVKVIDFGIAKATGQQVTDKTLFTNFAELIGTPLYLSPEQAGLSPGAPGDVDTRSDIYSLGVVLYELLTGTTPFDRQRFKEVDHDEMRRIIREEEPPRPSTRLSTLGLAATTVSNKRQSDQGRLCRLFRGELDWIVMKCLEKDRNRRYETASALAADVQRYLRDEPVQACPPSTFYRFQKLARRNKGTLATLIALGLILLTALVGLTATLVAVKRGSDETKAALSAEAKRRKQTRAALDAMASSVIEEWFKKQDKLGPEQKEFLAGALKHYEEFAADTAEDEESRAGVADAYRRVGIIRHLVAQHVESQAALQHSCQSYAALVDDFPANPEYREKLADAELLLAQAQKAAGKYQAAEGAFRRALDLYAQLANGSVATPGLRHNSASAYAAYGLLLAQAHRFADAEAAYDRAIGIRQQLVSEFPATPGYQTDLAHVRTYRALLFQQTARVSRAEEELLEARTVQEQLVHDFPRNPDYRRDAALTHDSLGILLARIGRAKEAEEAYRRALQLRRQLAAEYPAVIGYTQELAKSHNNLALLLEEAKRNTEAEESHRAAIAILKQLSLDFPDTPDFRRDLARSQGNLGILLKKLNRLVEAETVYREALQTRRQLAGDFPDIPAQRQDLAVTLNNLATLLRDTGRPKEAEQAYREALALHKELAERYAADPEHQNQVAGTMVNLGRFLYMQRSYSAARELLDDAVPYHRAALQANPRHVGYRFFYRNNRWRLTETLIALKEHAAAAIAAQEFLDAATAPQQDPFQVACLLAACVTLALNDDRLESGARLALAQSYGDRATAALRQAVDHGFKELDKIRKSPDLDPLRTRGDFNKLLAEAEAGIKK
jgi:serine/threonine protein kinase/tetratricopeptide (TPR) repeat protein